MSSEEELLVVDVVAERDDVAKKPSSILNQTFTVVNPVLCSENEFEGEDFEEKIPSLVVLPPSAKKGTVKEAFSIEEGYSETKVQTLDCLTKDRAKIPRKRPSSKRHKPKAFSDFVYYDSMPVEKNNPLSCLTKKLAKTPEKPPPCLLYTSDAADE